MDDVMMKKMENDAAALMRSVVAKRGRNVELAESAVRESKSFTDQEALDKKLIEYVAPTEQDLFRQISGKSFQAFQRHDRHAQLSQPAGARLSHDAEAAHPHLHHGPERRVHLLAIGALALYAEFNHPGAVIPGTVGVVFILLAVFALNLLPVRYAALVLIVGSFVLFALEAKFATTAY
jgi:membrane-bound serine protease (ClpP class)